VAAQLEQRNLETYFPRLKVFRKYLLPGKREVEPLFPGYLFARVSMADCYAEIHRMSGLREIVRFGGAFPHLEAEIIAALRRRETPEGYIRVRQDGGLRTLDRVEVTGGPFAGRRGLLARYLPASERVCVLFDWLQGQVRVEMPSGQVRSCTGFAEVSCYRP